MCVSVYIYIYMNNYFVKISENTRRLVSALFIFKAVLAPHLFVFL